MEKVFRKKLNERVGQNRAADSSASGILAGSALPLAGTPDMGLRFLGFVWHRARPVDPGARFRARAQERGARDDRAIRLRAQSAVPGLANDRWGICCGFAELVDRRRADCNVLRDLSS